jgi:hypothetical protein
MRKGCMGVDGTARGEQECRERRNGKINIYWSTSSKTKTFGT